ncbi:MAG: SAM-dependent chlorinase/fluorinase [Phycisphaerales bacterium]|nr:MAG: SAM-dependent chlorinase/fluorinase [Phycisphaerales bacterium]
MSLITLVTDFGTCDQYVGAIKGVIHQLAPKATVVDITHDIEPRNILRAAFVLRHVWPWYPRGTVHVVVVDPGVGSARQILVGRYAGQYVVAPDNGVITLVHRDLPLEALCVAEDRRNFLPKVSATFHGRDIMAPLAAKLSEGMSITKVGPPTDHVKVLSLPTPDYRPEHVMAGTILFVDRFGNLVSNISREDLASTLRHRPSAQVYLDGVCIGPIRTHYAEVPSGKPLALIDSTDYLEIAVNGGSAAERFQPAGDAVVEVR